MAHDDARFTGSIAQFYEQFMVPTFFEPYAVLVADAVREIAPRRVLETAAGTGALTRALLAALPEDAAVTATDLNAAMIDYAAEHVHDTRLRWMRADAQELPFAARTQDAVVCQFGVMFFPDPDQAYREARRVLADGGAFVFAVWDGLAQNDFARVVHDAAGALFPANPPQFIARTPHGHGDVTVHERRLAAAGFRDVTSRPLETRSRAPSAQFVATAVCQGTPLRNELLALDPDGLEAITDAIAHAVAEHFGNGTVEGAMRAYLITARP